MIEFTYPYMILFLPLPFIIRWLFFKKVDKTKGYQLKIPFFKELAGLKKYNSSKSVGVKFEFFLLLAAWSLIVLAASRPVEIGNSWTIDIEGRDLMIAIDASGSMARPEAFSGQTVTRFDVVKAVTKELIQKRKGDKVGLVIFGTSAFLYTPLSFDLNLVQNFLTEAYPGMAGPATAIGDALALSVKYLYKRPTKNKVLLLMTDGKNQGGRYSINEGVDYIKNAGIKVYVIGIGFSNFNGKEDVKDDEVDLDEPTLIDIASQSNGQYFRVNTPNDLKKVFSYIEQLEKIDESLIRHEVNERYFSFVLWAVAVLILTFIFHCVRIYMAKNNQERMYE